MQTEVVFFKYKPAASKRLITLKDSFARKFCDQTIRGCTQKFPDRVDNGIYTYLSYYSL